MILVHDYLLQMGGAERVVAVMHEAFPEAPILTSAVDRERLLPSLEDADVRTTWMQRLPGIRRHFKKYYLLYPAAFRSLPPIEERIAWISTTGYAKHVRASPGTVTYGYLHAPTRFLWDEGAYLEREIPSGALRGVVRASLRSQRAPDVEATRSLDHLIANSEHVRSRIREVYGRDATVIHPPVELSRFRPEGEPEDFYLVVSRLVGYKRLDRAVEAFSRSGRRLVVVGDGPDRARLEAMAGPSVELRGRVPDGEVEALMGTCRALVFPGTEDFGITAVEAQACGRPVIAWAGGGALETVVEGETGLFFGGHGGNGPPGNARTLEEAVEEAEGTDWDPSRIRRNAERFSPERFVRETVELIEATSDERLEPSGRFAEAR